VLQLALHVVNFGFEALQVRTAVGKNGAEAGVKFAGGGFSGDAGDVGGVESAAGHDDDAIRGGFDELAEDGSALRGVGGATGGEQAGSAGGYDVFEGAEQVHGFIEGAVEGDFEGARPVDEFGGALYVDGAIAAQDAEDDAFDAEIAGGRDAAFHDGEFRVGVDEISGARANDGEERQVEFLMHGAQHFQRRGEAAVDQFHAKFDAIGAATLRGESSVQGFDGNFQER